MAVSARLDIAARRNEARVINFRFVGMDLTTGGTDRLRMQVRLERDTPGPALFTLEQTTVIGEAGFRVLPPVEIVEGVPITNVEFRILKETMSSSETLPYMGEVGDSGRFVYGLQVDGQTRLEGQFWALATAIDCDDAPTDRPSGAGGTTPPSMFDSATVGFVGDEIVVTVDGLGIVAAIAVRADEAAAIAVAAAQEAADLTAAASFVTGTYTRSTDVAAETQFDGYGLIFKRTETDASERVKRSQIDDLTQQIVRHGPQVASIVTATSTMEQSIDGYGLIFEELTDTGKRRVAALEAPALATTVPGFFKYDILGLPIGGQSLSRGYNSIPPVTLAQPYNNVMLSAGVITYDTAATLGAQTFVSLVEQALNDGAGNPPGDGETLASGFANTWTALIEAKNGVRFDQHQHQFAPFCWGISATPITARVKGTTAYTRMLASVQRQFDLAQAVGKTYAVLVVLEAGGQSDMDPVNGTDAQYLARLKQHRVDIDADIRAITKQPEPVRMLIMQTAEHSFNNAAGTYFLDPKIARAQYQATLDDPLIAISCTPYFLQSKDGVHLLNTSSRTAGSYAGRAAHSLITLGSAWTGLRPKTWGKQGRLAWIDWNVPVPPLVLDTSTVSDPGQFGFEIKASDGSDIPITVPAPSDTRTTFVAASTIPAGAYLQIAHKAIQGQFSGPTTGPRCCLRDSDPTTDFVGTRLYNRPNILRLPL